MIKINKEIEPRLCQGDILKNIEYIESYNEVNGFIELSKIVFPLVIVLTQDCDLEGDFRIRKNSKNECEQDKLLISVLVAPIYNAEHLYFGEHLELLKTNSRKIGKDEKNFLVNNQIPRYHYLEFPEEIEIVPSVIDFKHYFSVHSDYILEAKQKKFTCKISELYRENISIRFSNYLSRIGLPNRK